jgi:hypothetical protein
MWFCWSPLKEGPVFKKENMYEVIANPELFLEEEIPELHPRSPLFKEY